MGHILVHAEGGRECAASHNRDPRQLQQALDGSILSVFTVKHWKRSVQTDRGEPGRRDNQQTVESAVRRDNRRSTVVTIHMPSVIQQSSQRTAVEKPAPIPRNAQRDRFIFLTIQMCKHCVGRLKRNCIFSGTAAKEDGQSYFFHHNASHCSILKKV